MKINLLLSTLATDRDPAYLERQKTCLESWHDYAHRVCYVNNYADVKELKYVENVEPKQAHPSLEQMVAIAATGRGLDDTDTIGIINADVGLEGNLKPIEDYMKKRQIKRAWAATSLRIENGATINWAYDIFIATKKVWKEINDVPSYLRLGEPMWDVWLNSWFNRHVGDHRYLDLTRLGIVNHMEHEKGREVDFGSRTIEIAAWGPPTTRL